MKAAKHKWNAEDYAKNSSAQLGWAQELIAKLALSGNESVLDIGCGDGKITAQIARTVSSGRVLGIDLSDSMIRFASSRHPSTRNPNLSFRQMDAADIRLPERFDIAFSNATLHWVQDHVAVLRGVHGALNGGGKILFQMGGYGAVAEVLGAIREVMRQSRWSHYFEGFTSPYHFYGPAEYEKWLSECGFQPKRVELIEKDMQHSGLDGLTDWLRTTWFPYTDCLPGEFREAFLAAVVETYTLSFPIDTKGHSHVRMVRLEVEGIAR